MVPVLGYSPYNPNSPGSDWLEKVDQKRYGANICSAYGQLTQPSTKPGVPWTRQLLNNIDAPSIANWTNDEKELLIDVCPMMANETRTCCDPAQVKAMKTNFDQIEQVVKCPACSRSLENFFCQMTCSPIQSEFYRVTELLWDEPREHKLVWRAEYYVNESFGGPMFNSCTGATSLQDPSSGVLGLLVSQSTKGLPATNYSNVMIDLVAYDPTSPTHSPYNIDVIYPEWADLPKGKNMTWLNGSHIISENCYEGPYACQPFMCPRPHSGSDENKTHVETVLDRINATGGNLHYSLVLGYDDISQETLGNIMLYTGISLCSIVIAAFIIGEIVSRGKKKYAVYRARKEHEKMLRMRNPKFTYQKYKYKAYMENKLASESTTSRTRLKLDESKSTDAEGATAGVGTENMPAKPFITTKYLKRYMRWHGAFVARNPHKIMLVAILCVIVCASGLWRLEVLSEPVDLWVETDSIAYQQKDFYSRNFNPFFRTDVLIVLQKDHSKSVFDDKFLHAVMKLLDKVADLKVSYGGNNNITLDSLCFKPTLTGCSTQSAMQFFQMNMNTVEEYMKKSPSGASDHIRDCITAGGSGKTCVGTFGAPMNEMNVYFGAFTNDQFNESRALVHNYLLNNYDEKAKNGPAEEWEKAFINLMKYESENNQDLDIAFYTESSVQLEIEAETYADVPIIALSYIVMFIYVSIALGRWPNSLSGSTFGQKVSYMLVGGKFILGMMGVVAVIFSVAATFGVFAWIGVPVSMIVLEVVPFLVLAVGVDNIFILVQAFDRLPEGDIADMTGEVLVDVGPSITYAFFAEAISFTLGSTSNMPAVKSFAETSAMAVLFNTLLQFTFFMAYLTIDKARQRKNKSDCAICVTVSTDNGWDKAITGSSHLIEDVFRFISDHILFQRLLQPIVIIGFIVMFCFSGYYAGKVQLGLDQKDSVLQTSYLIKFFDYQVDFLEVGPPTFFVISEPLDYQYLEIQNKVASSSQEESVIKILQSLTTDPYNTYFEINPASWLDTYYSFIDPNNGASRCCRIDDATGEFVPPSPVPAPNSHTCLPDYEVFQEPVFHGDPQHFVKYYDYFKNSPPGDSCPSGGMASFGQALSLGGTNNETVLASNFRMLHTTLRTQSDFIQALRNSRTVCEFIKEKLGIDMFAYTFFYPFFEQYLESTHATMQLIMLSLIAIFVVHLATGKFIAAFCVTLCVFLVVVNVCGAMYFWDISLNGISQVNLVIVAGIAVEFTSHIAYSFYERVGSPTFRAKEALTYTGSSVFSGITITKLIGVSVLSATHSQIFVIYYFRMYFVMVISGALHGLILLPILLDCFGRAFEAIPFCGKPTPDYDYVDAEGIVYEESGSVSMEIEAPKEQITAKQPSRTKMQDS
eukprot:Nk52_evm24s232 gene=Nk52_evmTU24s232